MGETPWKFESSRPHQHAAGGPVGVRVARAAGLPSVRTPAERRIGSARNCLRLSGSCLSGSCRKIDDLLRLMPLRKLRYQDRAGTMQQRAPRWALMWLEKRGLVRRVIVKSEVWWELMRRDVIGA